MNIQSAANFNEGFNKISDQTEVPIGPNKSSTMGKRVCDMVQQSFTDQKTFLFYCQILTQVNTNIL